MGLDFSHSDAHWSYGGFHRFRTLIASSIGISLNNMQGFKDNGLPWSSIKDPLRDFLYHSDCDGELSPTQCSLIGKRLVEVCSNWEDCFDKEMGLKLGNDMIECGKNKQTLEFM